MVVVAVVSYTFYGLYISTPAATVVVKSLGSLYWYMLPILYLYIYYIHTYIVTTVHIFVVTVHSYYNYY